ncbi:hypothetical protein SAMN05216334_10128 [Nitrosomonas ureae]|uniref:Uncharacterized protein n=1 Tax=Nitrosomonas ureae TaxID=44577 RepID=A0A1H5RKX4_9PROT|nr:hypothetical protein SAMN05216334_10128 [Nitrosomonas ureae]
MPEKYILDHSFPKPKTQLGLQKHFKSMLTAKLGTCGLGLKLYTFMRNSEIAYMTNIIKSRKSYSIIYRVI